MRVFLKDQFTLHYCTLASPELRRVQMLLVFFFIRVLRFLPFYVDKILTRHSFYRRVCGSVTEPSVNSFNRNVIVWEGADRFIQYLWCLFFFNFYKYRSSLFSPWPLSDVSLFNMVLDRRQSWPSTCEKATWKARFFTSPSALRRARWGI